MPAVKLTSGLKPSKHIAFNSILYPNEPQAIFNKNSFGGKKLHHSVHYKTCVQIEDGVELSKLDYYNWTIEKLNRFGNKYEKFLFSATKGCNVADYSYSDLEKKTTQERRKLMARSVSKKFCDLFDSVMKKWDPKLSRDDIYFFKLFNHKFMINEGRHRICILYYKYRIEEANAFEINAMHIRRDYYYLKFKKHLKQLFQKW